MSEACATCPYVQYAITLEAVTRRCAEVYREAHEEAIDTLADLVLKRVEQLPVSDPNELSSAFAEDWEDINSRVAKKCDQVTEGLWHSTIKRMEQMDGA